MLITVEDLKAIYTDLDFSKFSDERLKRKLDAIETLVRNHTHNNFTNRATRTECFIEDNELVGDLSLFKVGNTIQIVGGVNEGIYTIEELYDGFAKLDKDIYNSDEVVIYRVDYPADVIEGSVVLLNYDCNKENKIGISSESLSRHSVSYVNYNESNTKEGYPSELLGFLRKYAKWRT